MKLGLTLQFQGKNIHVPMDFIHRAEALGFDSVWTAEAYGSEAVSPAAWVLGQTTSLKVGTAIMQMPARTPAMAAMTAMTLSQLSGGRFIMGLGASGPQVVEGWHGVPYGKPVTRTREYIEIVRKIMAREEPVSYDGDIYQLPNNGDGTTGLGKSLKSILAPDTATPIYTAAITPAGIRCAAKVADGLFPIWMNPDRFDVFAEDLAKGFSQSTNTKSLDDFSIAPFVQVSINDDLDAAYDALRPWLALYVGGMGAKGKNFYHDYVARLGYADAATEIQDHYLSGDRTAAMAAIPKALLDDIALVGPWGRIKERLQAWRAANSRSEVDSMLLNIHSAEHLEWFAQELL